MDQCKNPFHTDGCPGAAGGEHELRASEQMWCQHCEQAAVFAVRFPYGIEALCARHGLELAQDATAYAVGALQHRASEERPFRPHLHPGDLDHSDPTVTPQMAQYQAEGR